MNLVIVLAALAFLMLAAYRGYSVILFAPIAALGAVLLTDPSLVPPMFSSVFMEKMVVFVKNYFPVFMLGAVFGKVIEKLGEALHQRSFGSVHLRKRRGSPRSFATDGESGDRLIGPTAVPG